MYTQSLPGYTIRYGDSHIVLHGDTVAIHHEARRILSRFAASALPYRVVADFKRCMWLRTTH